MVNVKNLKTIIKKSIPRSAIGLRLRYGSICVIHDYDFKFICPHCNQESTSYDEKDLYCPKCGQKFSKLDVHGDHLHTTKGMIDAEV